MRRFARTVRRSPDIANCKHPRVGPRSSRACAHADCTGADHPNPRLLLSTAAESSTDRAAIDQDGPGPAAADVVQIVDQEQAKAEMRLRVVSLRCAAASGAAIQSRSASANGSTTLLAQTGPVVASIWVCADAGTSARTAPLFSRAPLDACRVRSAFRRTVVLCAATLMDLICARFSNKRPSV